MVWTFLKLQSQWHTSSSKAMPLDCSQTVPLPGAWGAFSCRPPQGESALERSVLLMCRCGPGACWSPLIADVPDSEQEVCPLMAIWKSLLPGLHGFMALFPRLIFHIASMCDSWASPMCSTLYEVPLPLITPFWNSCSSKVLAAATFFSLRHPERITWMSLLFIPFLVCFCLCFRVPCP